jgi:isopentenyl-diphosphate delta-isomerase
VTHPPPADIAPNAEAAVHGGRSEEHVVLLDDLGNAIGSVPKETVHNATTPLHLAFSCYVFDRAGSLLVTRRAAGKLTWPGVWTNSFCGHPLPGEDVVTAVRRRAAAELGIGLREVRLVLPAFRYRASMANGTTEHEICPVFVALSDDQAQPAPDEVAEAAWVPWHDFVEDVLGGSRELSPWCTEQVRAMACLGAHPAGLAEADWSALPPAARRVG